MTSANDDRPHGQFRPKTIVYLRSRPSEPKASARALERQRAALARELPDAKIVAEFVEQEGDDGERPAWAEAQRLLHTLLADEWTEFVTVTRAAIGSGQPMVRDPELPPEILDPPDGQPRFIALHHELAEVMDPAPEVIVVDVEPDGGPRLRGVTRYGQQEVCIYLCNTGSEVFRDIRLAVRAAICANEADAGPGIVMVREMLRSGEGIIVNHTSLACISDEGSDYHLSFAAADGRHRHMVATDGWCIFEGSDWVAFRETQPVDTPKARGMT